MIVPLNPFRRRRPAAAPAAPPGPGALVLVSAVYNSGLAVLELTFDRAIDVDEMDGSQITVNDPVSTGNLLAATGRVEQPSGEIVSLEVLAVGPSSGSDVVLNATADTGIVAQADGAAWAGAVDVGLPFP